MPFVFAGTCGVIAELKDMHWRPYNGGSILPCWGIQPFDAVFMRRLLVSKWIDWLFVDWFFLSFRYGLKDLYKCDWLWYGSVVLFLDVGVHFCDESLYRCIQSTGWCNWGGSSSTMQNPIYVCHWMYVYNYIYTHTIVSWIGTQPYGVWWENLQNPMLLRDSMGPQS